MHGRPGKAIAILASCSALTVATILIPSYPAYAGRLVRCEIASVENPHYSKGAGGVIFKTRISCDGKTMVRFHGVLTSGPEVGPLELRATRDEERVVSGTATFYVPPQGSPGVPCDPNQFYQASADLSAVTGASESGQRVRVACP